MSELDIIAPATLPDEPPPQPAGNPAPQADQHQEDAATSTEADQTGADDLEHDDGAEGDNADQPKKPKGVQKRLDELTRQREDAKRERDYWRDMAMRGGQPQQPPNAPAPQTAAPPADAAPKIEDFQSYDDFLVAKAKHELRQEMTQAERAKAAAQESAQVATNWRTQVEAAKGKYADFEEVAFTAPLSEPVAQMVAASDIGADLAYHLGKNPDEARRISALSPVAAAREIGRLEAKLSTAPSPKTTQAPPPVPTVTGRSSPQRDPNAMSYEEYKAMRMGKKK